MLLKDNYDEKINFGVIHLKGPTKEKLASLKLIDQEDESVVKCTLSTQSQEFAFDLAREERSTPQLIKFVEESYLLLFDKNGLLEFQPLSHL